MSCVPKRIDKLEITEVGEIRLRSLGSKLIRMDVTLGLRNPYRTTAKASHVSFLMKFRHDFFAKGYLVESFQIEPRSTAKITVPMVVDCVKVRPEDLNVLFESAIPYTFAGTLKLEAPVRAEKVELNASGAFKAPRILEVTLQDRSVLNMISMEDYTIQDFLMLLRKGQIRVTIRNPFSFNVEVDEMQYQAGIASVQLAEGKASGPLDLKPGENQVVLSVSPRLLGAAQGVLQGLSGKRTSELDLTAILLLRRNDRELSIRLRYSSSN